MRKTLKVLATVGVSLLGACGGGEEGSSGATAYGRAAPMLAGGANQTCALSAYGTVQCWGSNSFGQLGDGNMAPMGEAGIPIPLFFVAPVSVSGISTAIQIAAGGHHTCAVLSSGAVQCWGNNVAGQLGNGTNANSAVPTTVSGISQATWVTTGAEHSCAVISDGTVQCWGRNDLGELGNGSILDSNIPVRVSGISDATKVASNGGHSCALLRDATVRCWGYGIFGQLGSGTNIVTNTTPVAVSGISNATAIAVGGNHTCALLIDQTVRCWGYNSQDQLGIGTSIFPGINTPAGVIGLSSVIALSLGGDYGCAVISGGTLKCWGAFFGFQGKVTVFSERSMVPVSVDGIANAVAVSVGYGGVCALVDDGTVRCWGVHPLGDGTMNDSHAPVTVSGINGQGVLNLGTS